MIIRDWQTRGYLASMWITAFIALFGLESRALTYSSNAWLFIILALAFVISVFIIRRKLVAQLSRSVKVFVNGKTIYVKPTRAHEKVEHWVQSRVEHLGLSAKVDVLYLPHTWNRIDAFVYGRGKRQVLVITGGSQALLLRNRPEDLEKFQLLIDHELGHIANNDTNLLYLAKAILFSMALFIPIKLLLQLLFDWNKLFNFYADLFPPSLTIVLLSPGPLGIFLPSPSTLSPSIIIAIVVLYTGIIIFTLIMFYIGIVRRREFWADYFASLQFSNLRRANEVFLLLSRSAGLRSLPPHSFFGDERWHPPLSERISSFGLAPRPGAFSYRIASLLILVFLVSYRFAFGKAGLIDRTLNSEILTPLSYLFIFLCAYSVSCLIHPIMTDEDSANTERNQAIKSLLLLGFVVSICLWLIQTLMAGSDSQFSSENQDRYATILGYKYIFEIEAADRNLMVFSIPIALGCFIVSHVFFYSFVRRLHISFNRVNIINTVFVSILAWSLLWAISFPVSSGLTVYRATKYNEFVKQRYERIDNARRFPPSKLFPQLPQSTPLFDDKTHQEELDILILVTKAEVPGIKEVLDNHQFNPPLSLFWLWQGPFRAHVIFEILNRPAN